MACCICRWMLSICIIQSHGHLRQERNVSASRQKLETEKEVSENVSGTIGKLRQERNVSASRQKLETEKDVSENVSGTIGSVDFRNRGFEQSVSRKEAAQLMAVAKGILSTEKLEKLCNFRDSTFPWESYRSGSMLEGELVFNGGGGQGIGNVFAGLAGALYYAMQSQRRIVIQFDPELLPPHPDGPDWQSKGPDGPDWRPQCTCSLTVFNQDGRRSTESDIKRILTDKKRCPAVCFSGNFEALHGFARLVLAQNNEKFAALMNSTGKQIGCAFHFLFDLRQSKALAVNGAELMTEGGHRPSGSIPSISSAQGKAENDGLLVVGHLRLGDPHMRNMSEWAHAHSHMGMSGTWNMSGNMSDMRAVLSAPGIGGNVNVTASQFIECAQQIAAQKMSRFGGTQNWRSCSIVFVSDTEEAKTYLRTAVDVRRQPCDLYVPPSRASHVFKSEPDLQSLSDFLLLVAGDVDLLTQSGFGESASRMGPQMLDDGFSARDYDHHGKTEQEVEGFKLLQHTFSFEAMLTRGAETHKPLSNLCDLNS